MSAGVRQLALLPNLASLRASPLAMMPGLAEYQSCLDAGARAAMGFFDALTDIGLHDHLAGAMQSFSASVSAGMAAAGAHQAATLQRCLGAFAAGYLGRIRKELRIVQDESRQPSGASHTREPPALHPLK